MKGPILLLNFVMIFVGCSRSSLFIPVLVAIVNRQGNRTQTNLTELIFFIFICEGIVAEGWFKLVKPGLG
jgi:hypothetical protein